MKVVLLRSSALIGGAKFPPDVLKIWKKSAYYLHHFAGAGAWFPFGLPWFTSASAFSNSKKTLPLKF
jgi:hypothetical protein